MARRRSDAAELLDTYGVLKRCLHAVATRAYAEAKLGTTQVRFLKQIAGTPGISQAELARATETDPALTGRALQTLLERGWVRRTHSPADRRAYVLELGAAGRRVLKRVELVRARVAEQMAATLDDRDVDDFKRVVAKIVAALSPR